PGRFYDEYYAIPNPEKKDRVHVKLQAHPGAIAGGFFFAKTLRAEMLND
ncbi:MAG: hypothetical protein HUK22_04325, partial [Thermoguttaceae bacterium]|nr:hypothetical protein [Thermoguttaceae bacterium]